MEKMHPFFGNTWDAASNVASMDPEECLLITQILEGLNPELDALVSYDLVRKFIALKYVVRTGKCSVTSIATTLERFLNWAFFVRRLSPLKMQSEDIIKFCEFYFEPPIGYLRTERICKRFTGVGALRYVNPNWKPFFLVPTKNADSVASVLRRFYKYISQTTTMTMTPPRGRLRDNSNSSEELLRVRALVGKYFEILKENMEAPVKRRPSHTSRNKQIFVFATCYLLEIPFAKLARFTRFFSMSSFSSKSNAWYLNLQNDEELIFRELSVEYINILREFRGSIGLDGMPSPDEIHPIFGSRRAIEHVWSSLPVFGFMNTTIGQHLRKLTSCSGKKGALDKLLLNKPGNTVHARLTKKTLRVAFDILEDREYPENFGRSSSPPPSLFTYQSENSRVVEFVDPILVRIKISKCIVGIGDNDLSAINMFVLYANSVEGKKNRYKVNAFEKLVLWCILIKGINVARLTDQDAMEFFDFCSTPPPHWCSNNSSRSNTEWRPFKLLTNEHSLNLRAARIVGWCSAVTQDLIDMAALGYNPFSEISTRLGSSKHH